LNEAIRVLFVEDSPDDAELTTARLVAEGYKVEAGLVDNAADMRQALLDESWHIVLCDYSMPGFDPFAALQLLRELRLDIPFIVISGMISEENVVKLMKEGCHDCVKKDDMTRLAGAVRRELGEAKIRAEHRRMTDRLEKYQILAEKAADAILFVNLEGKIIEVNAAATQLYGYSFQEFATMTIGDLSGRTITAADLQRKVKQWREAHKKGISYETVHCDKNGVSVHVEINSHDAIINDQPLLVSIVRDITRRRLAEVKTLKLFRAVENSPVAVVIANRDGEIEYANPRFTQISGYTIEEVLGKNPRIFKSGIHTEDYYTNLWQTLLAENEWRGEFCNKKKTGELYWESASISILRDEAGEITNFVAVKEDITERKRLIAEQMDLQKKKAVMERMVSLGTLAAGVAHEINQPLQALKVTSDGVLYWHGKGSPPDLEKMLEGFRRISAQANRIASIVQRMRDFVNRISSEKMSEVDLNEAVRRGLDLLRERSQSHGVELIEKLEASVPVMGDQGRLEEVVINIVVNAIHALDSVKQSPKEITISTRSDERLNYLDIGNNGPAIPADIIGKIFDPFFTSRHSGENMGLGLAIVQSIIADHGGKISVYNDKSRVVFRIELPQNRGER